MNYNEKPLLVVAFIAPVGSILITTFILTYPVYGYVKEDLKELLQTNYCQNCDLQGADLRGVNLSGADLRGVNLSSADLRESKLINADLEGADFTFAVLIASNLNGANLKNARLQGTNLMYAKLEGVNLSGANLEDADMRDARLRGVNFNNAKVKGADFKWARDLTNEQKYYLRNNGAINVSEAALINDFYQLPESNRSESACLESYEYYGENNKNIDVYSDCVNNYT